MDSNSLDKTLNSILNTLPRTLAPSDSISIFRKKVLKKSLHFLELNIAISRKNSGASMQGVENCLQTLQKMKVNKNPENWQCAYNVRMFYRFHKCTYMCSNMYVECTTMLHVCAKRQGKAHLLSEVNSEIFRNQIYFSFFPKYLNPRRKLLKSW